MNARFERSIIVRLERQTPEALSEFGQWVEEQRARNRLKDEGLSVFSDTQIRRTIFVGGERIKMRRDVHANRGQLEYSTKIAQELREAEIPFEAEPQVWPGDNH